MPPSDELSSVPHVSGDERVHVFRRRFDEFAGLEVDAYVIATRDYLVVLDTLLCPADAATMLQSVHKELQGRQLLVVNSHADWDHVWGNSYFTGKHQAPIIAHDACLSRLLASEARRELADFQARYPLFRDVVLTPPTITFAHSLTIHGGDLTVQLLHAPGHERDHCAAWLPELRLLLAFDALEMPLPLLYAPEGVPQMFATLAHFRALQPARVLCSHSKSTGSDIIDANLTYLHTLEQGCRIYLRTHSHPTPEEFSNAAERIGYPFDEAHGNLPEPLHREFYSEAHNENIRHMMQWIRM